MLAARLSIFTRILAGIICGATGIVTLRASAQMESWSLFVLACALTSGGIALACGPPRILVRKHASHKDASRSRYWTTQGPLDAPRNSDGTTPKPAHALALTRSIVIRAGRNRRGKVTGTHHRPRS